MVNHFCQQCLQVLLPSGKSRKKEFWKFGAWFNFINQNLKWFPNVQNFIFTSWVMSMYWTNFWQPTVHVQQNISGKILLEIWSPYLCASFGTFCFPIGQLFEERASLTFLKNSKSATLSFKKDDLSISKYSSKTHFYSNIWSIWT